MVLWGFFKGFYFLDLWLLAIYYEFEINNNPFKARDLFH